MFQGERTTWITPVALNDLLELKAKYPKAPLVMGNTAVGGCFKVCSLGNPNTVSLFKLLINAFIFTRGCLCL